MYNFVELFRPFEQGNDKVSFETGCVERKEVMVVVIDDLSSIGL